MPHMSYRLALDLGSTSLGWAMIRLNADKEPCAIIKAGVRIFSDGRNSKDGSSLAVTRREARAMRRRRDRLLKRKARMMNTLVVHGFFPQNEAERKALEKLDPYALRFKGLEEALTPQEFARALFHINQRRGFKSNRKTDKKDNGSGALKSAISELREMLRVEKFRTVGEWLHKRNTTGQSVRARFRQNRITTDEGKARTIKSYDLYIDRSMIEAEFDALWEKQAQLNPTLFNPIAHADLKDCLLHQRPLKPVIPGRCTLLPEEVRAPLALPSTQRFRIYQEVNNLRILGDGLKEEVLTLEQRDKLVAALEFGHKSFKTAIPKLLGLADAAQFNLADAKRTELKGNVTSMILGGTNFFGDAWFALDEAQQDAIVMRIVQEENEASLIRWLQAEAGIDEQRAERIANVGLPEGYGSLSAKALACILPELRLGVVTYDKAVQAAGIEHHSHVNRASTGEVLPALPYYGEPLQRHVGFGTGNSDHTPEKRFGRIANPTVHIGLNQVRLVVNILIRRYGHPSEVIVEVARELKQSREHRKEEAERQALNQQRNERLRATVSNVLRISPERVKATDIQKMILWEELSLEPAYRKCPYSGVEISVETLLSDQVEIEHILPFSETLDDSLNNKTVALRTANRVKGNRTPWQAFGAQATTGFNYLEILQRAEQMPKIKRYRFAEEGYRRWLKDDAGFLPRALNDTRYLSKIAREYVSLICPQNTRVIPGRMTAMLRGKFELNRVLSSDNHKNRNDHRHHAVDACVIAITDQSLLQRFARASANAREQQLIRLVDDMPLPWPTFREHVERAVQNIWVSHKPDHCHEGAMHNDTAYGLLGNGRVSVRKIVDGVRQRVEGKLKVIEFTSAKSANRHGLLPNGELRPYKGYKGDSNYCIEIVHDEKGKWDGEVISTFDAYQLVRQHGVSRLRHPTVSISGRPLIMRLIRDDCVRICIDGKLIAARVAWVKTSTQIGLAPLSEANTDARSRSKEDEFDYIAKTASALRNLQARRITVSPIGDIFDPGFKG